MNSTCPERLREKERLWDIGESHKRFLLKVESQEATERVGTGQITEVLIMGTPQ